MNRTITTTERWGVWTVRWSNPRKPRPDGFPEIFLELRIPLAKGQGAGQCPQEIHECWEEMRHYGYGVSWHLDAPPARTLPLESKQRIRRRNLWKRLVKRYPMFLETFYAERVRAHPEYYGELVPGEFADVVFVQTTHGHMKQQKKDHAA